MKARIFLIVGGSLGALIILGFFLLYSILDGWFYDPANIVRPESVPAEALWAGGMDGGHWVYCESSTFGKRDCTIYDHPTGDLAVQGKFTIEVPDDAKLQFLFFDGNAIHSKEGVLKPTGEHIYYLGNGDTVTKLFE